jgi:hypothetical protein
MFICNILWKLAKSRRNSKWLSNKVSNKVSFSNLRPVHSYGTKPRKIKRDGKTLAIYYVQVYDKATSKQTWKSTGQRSYKLACEWLKTRQLEQALGFRADHQKVRELTFADAYAAWLGEKRGRVTDGYVLRIAYRGEYWKRFFRGKALRDVSREDVVTLLEKRRRGTITSGKKRVKPFVHGVDQ